MDYPHHDPQRQLSSNPYPHAAPPVYPQAAYPPQYAYPSPGFLPPAQNQPPIDHTRVLGPPHTPQHPSHYALPQQQHPYMVPPPPPPPPQLQPFPQLPQLQQPHTPHQYQYSPQVDQNLQQPYQQPLQQPSPSIMPPKLAVQPQVMIPKAPRPQTSAPPTPAQASPQIDSDTDYPNLMMSLAEEYIAAAYQIGSRTALYRQETELAKYYKLMATGLGFMDAVLNNFRLPPRTEATLRLRYASLLFEETETATQSETALSVEAVLSKGIALCQRSRLLDLKYSMQHLLARILFKSNPKAAFKSLETVITEAEGYQHTVWVYAFRFLAVTLSLQIAGSREIAAALNQLHSISALARRQGDIAVYVTSSAFEALAHLRTATPDGLEQAQRSIASARSYQLQIPSIGLKQVVALLDFLDLACSLQNFSPDQANSKLHALQATMDDEILTQVDDGVTFGVPIEHGAAASLTLSTAGIFTKDKQGRDLLTFSWLSGKALYALSYYLSSVTHYHRVDDKASKYLKEGIRLLQDHIHNDYKSRESTSGATQRLQWLLQMQWYMKQHLAFILCSQQDWDAARGLIGSLEQEAKIFDPSDQEPLQRVMAYLKGVLEQGTGNLDAALSIYQLPIFSLEDAKSTKINDQTDLCILAGINTLFICHGNPAQHKISSDYISRLEPLCLAHTNKNFTSAFNLAKALHTHKESIVQTKQSLQAALYNAKITSNQNLLCLSMNLMTSLFFSSILGEQALSSARASAILAKRAKDTLWTCVASSVYAEALKKRDKVDEAAQYQVEADQLIDKLPPALQDAVRNA